MKKFLIWLMAIAIVVTLSSPFLKNTQNANTNDSGERQVTSFTTGPNGGPWPPPEDGG